MESKVKLERGNRNNSRIIAGQHIVDRGGVTKYYYADGRRGKGYNYEIDEYFVHYFCIA